jgi:hypothetical protein
MQPAKDGKPEEGLSARLDQRHFRSLRGHSQRPSLTHSSHIAPRLAAETGRASFSFLVRKLDQSNQSSRERDLRSRPNSRVSYFDECGVASVVQLVSVSTPSRRGTTSQHQHQHIAEPSCCKYYYYLRSSAGSSAKQHRSQQCRIT